MMHPEKKKQLQLRLQLLLKQKTSIHSQSYMLDELANIMLGMLEDVVEYRDRSEQETNNEDISNFTTRP